MIVSDGVIIVSVGVVIVYGGVVIVSSFIGGCIQLYW